MAHTLNADQKAKYDQLTGLGLPEEQALKSVTARPVPSNVATHIYAMLKIKAGLNDKDMAALERGLKAYSAASRAAAGKVTSSYSICDGEVQFMEIYNGPGAMDAHIADCFPDYTTILPYADMTEIVAVCDPAEVEWWKKSAAAWGASKFIVTPAM